MVEVMAEEKMRIDGSCYNTAQQPAPPLIVCMTSFIYKCALFGIVRIMLGRFTTSLLLVNYLPRLRLNVARRSIIAASSVRLLSRSYGRNGPDDGNGAGHSKSEESPTAKLERSFQLLGINQHDCTVEQIRKAYIDLVKRYHPDSKAPHASAEKSAEVCITL
jgi:hypothetical protein